MEEQKISGECLGIGSTDCPRFTVEREAWATRANTASRSAIRDTETVVQIEIGGASHRGLRVSKRNPDSGPHAPACRLVAE